MWSSDKPVVQEAESISQLIHLPQVKVTMLFYKGALEAFLGIWNTTVQNLDKYPMVNA